ncbi:MAG: SH3 domain-containing protein [Lachnospiraceae bacterium]|nr:SH3 domain-containing protein [Lachnospiraceae bacterium]
MKKIMKKAVVPVLLCLLLCACGQPAQPVAAVTETTESQVEETEAVSETESVVEETVAESTTEEATEVTESETVTEESTSEETETVEETTESATEEATEETEKAPIVVTRLEEPKTLYATMALNIRRGPSKDYEKAGSLAMAEAVTVLGQADTGWYFFMRDGQAVYASGKYLSETQPEIPAPAPAAPAAPAGPAQAVAAPAGVIMVGDSRCVQMQEAVGGGGCSWICENSKEYTWFVEKAIPRFDPYVGKGTKVVINMGVNDPEHYRSYAEIVNAKAAEWAARGAKTYFVSVNPVWENPYTDQADVDTFNANVPGMLSGVRWIDTSSWLNANGYRLVDGLHYDAPTYVNIFNLIMGSL